MSSSNEPDGHWVRCSCQPAATGPLLRLIPAHDAEWGTYTDSVPHDFFHTNVYHRAWTEMQGGEAFLAVYGRPEKYVAWPYVRQVIEGLGSANAQPLYDITSAYGYVGPLLRGCEDDPQFLGTAWREFCVLWRSQCAITVFTRFHPILANHRWLLDIVFSPSEGSPSEGGAEVKIIEHGRTVAIDLHNSNEEVWSGYKRQLRQSIRRGIEAGVHIIDDTRWDHLGDFVRLYYSTMIRNRASQFYHFPVTYFERLKAVPGCSTRLLVATYNGTAIAAAILFECHTIANLFLLGADSDYLALSPVKLLFHQAQAWARERGNRYLHFGGGRGCRDDDDLFRFKCLFSSLTFPFYTGRWILDQKRYDELLLKSDSSDAVHRSIAEDFFPSYRRQPGSRTCGPR